MRKLENNELGRPSIEDFKGKTKYPIVIILDNLRSLHNVGSIFRTADAFLIEKIYLCGITAKPPHKDIQKTALGATESVAWEYTKDPLNIIRSLKEKSYGIIAVEQTEKSTSLQNFSVCKKARYGLIFGNEVRGIQQQALDIADHAIEIPQFGTKHSLNVSVSAGVILWHFIEKYAY